MAMLMLTRGRADSTAGMNLRPASPGPSGLLSRVTEVACRNTSAVVTWQYHAREPVKWFRVSSVPPGAWLVSHVFSKRIGSNTKVQCSLQYENP
jgi:hypothetical protein